MSSKGVRVNSVNPGTIRTSIFEKFGITETEPYFDEINKDYVLVDRVGEESDTSNAITYLSFKYCSLKMIHYCKL